MRHNSTSCLQLRGTVAMLVSMLWVSLTVVPSFSQEPTIVDLTQQLDQSKRDTSRVKLLNQLALRHLDLNQLDKGLARAVEALGLADSLEYLAGQAQAQEVLGLHSCYSNHFQEAIGHYTLSARMYDTLGWEAQKAGIINEVGSIYHQMALYDSALNCLSRSVRVLDQLGDSSLLADAYNRIGLVYTAKGEYEAGLEFFMKSIALSQQVNDVLGLSRTYCHMGKVYRQLEDFQKAREFLSDALKLNQQSGPTRDIIDIYLELGILDKTIEKYDEAILQFKKSLNLARYYNNQQHVAECLSQIGAVYHRKNEYETALSFYKRALNLLNDMELKQGIVLTSNRMAMAYLDMVEVRRSGTFNQFSVNIVSEADIFELLDRSVAMARESGDFNDLISSYETLIRASGTFERYARAIHYQDILLRYKDSIDVLVHSQDIARLQAEYQQKEQEEKIRLLNSDKKVQESIMKRQQLEGMVYVGGAITLIVIIIGLFNRLRYINRTRKELQHRNRQIEEEKSRAQRSENIKEQFLAKMSHEIRTPMNTIMGSVNILLKGNHYRSQEKYLKAINQSSENLLVIIDDILDLTELQAGNIKLEHDVFNIRSEVSNVEQILKFKARDKRIKLKTVVDEQVPEAVVGDSTRLNQILVNLAGNALKFTEQGKVVIHVHLKNLDQGNAQVLFSVEDTGIGIPADRLEKIFRSFTQADGDTNRKYGGTGLGLTISKQLVELQGGRMQVSSEVGKGSVFSFELSYPVSENEVQGLNKQGLRPVENLRGLRILVVEDDEFNCMVLGDSLNDAFEEVTIDVAMEGNEAYRKWQEQEFDIILMDIELPGMNGHQITEAIREQERGAPGIPIIAMTANAMQHEVEACFACGMSDYIAKPFDPEELILKINSNLIDKMNKEG